MKIIVSLILAIFLISLVSAELLIQPTSWDITIKKGTSQTFSLNLTNTFTFPIMDFEFKNLSGFTFPNITIGANQSVLVNYVVLKNELEVFSKDINVNFKYLVDIPPNPQTIYVNITSTGFKPDFVTIHEGDTIVWTNSDDVSHTVTSGSFDSQEINPSQIFSRTFNTIQTIDYQDFILLWGGRIEVLSKSAPQKVNNPNYNKIVHINLNVFSDPTNLTFNILDKNYTADSTNTAEGMITLKNIGSQPAQKVKLTSDKSWLIFDKNDFDLDVNQQVYVPFKIKPLLLSNNETNRTYIINVRAGALNTEAYNYSINVYVPYSNVENMGTDAGFLIFYARFCEQNPTFAICTGKINDSGSGNQIIYRDPEIPINLTATQVYSLLKRIQQIQDSNARTDNEVKLLKDQMSEELPEIKGLLNESVTLSKSGKDKSDSTSSTFWVASIMIILIIGCFVSVKLILKYNDKRNMMVKVKP